MLKHPTQKHGKTQEDLWKNVKFLSNILEAATTKNISVPYLMKIHEKVEEDFVDRNSLYVGFSRYLEVMDKDGSGRKVTVDTRALATYLENTQQNVSQLSIDLKSMRTKVAAQEEELRTLRAQRAQLLGQNSQVLQNQALMLQMLVKIANGNVPQNPQNLAQTIQVPLNMLPQAPPAAAAAPAPPPAIQQTIPTSFNSLGGVQAKNEAQEWYMIDYPSIWSSVKGKSSSHRVNYANIKRTTSILTLFFKSEVPNLPPNVNSPRERAAAAWKENLEAQINDAWNDVKIFAKNNDVDLQDNETVHSFVNKMDVLIKKDGVEVPQGPTKDGGRANDVLSLEELKYGSNKSQKRSRKE